MTNFSQLYTPCNCKKMLSIFKHVFALTADLLPRILRKPALSETIFPGLEGFVRFNCWQVYLPVSVAIDLLPRANANKNNVTHDGFTV